MRIKITTFLLVLIFSQNFYSQITITEIYYDTPDNEKLRFIKKVNGLATQEEIEAVKHHRGEFIEIYNYSDKDVNLKDLIMLSQGYGFYSMSGIVVTELKNAELGSIALMNDLFREVIAILLMNSIGWRYPRSAISAAAATAMDVTLPMVKQACGNDFIPHAMVSGFILSILAPIAISILAAF